MSAFNVVLKYFLADGTVGTVDVKQGEVVSAETGARYVLSVDGLPLPPEAELHRVDDSLRVTLDDETLIELEDWCSIGNSAFDLLTPEVHAQALQASELSVDQLTELTVQSGDCALYAQGVQLGHLAEGLGAVAVAGTAATGYSLWQILGAGAGLGVVAIAASGAGSDDSPSAAAPPTGERSDVPPSVAEPTDGDEAGDSSEPAEPEDKLPFSSGVSHPDAPGVDESHISSSAPMISGAADPDLELVITLSTGEKIVTRADADGRWSVTPASALDDGEYEYSIAAFDEQGAAVGEFEGVFVVDTVAPDAPVVDQSAEQETPRSDAQPVISGVGQNPGNTVSVAIETGETLDATVSNDSSWSVTPTQPLPDGPTSVTVTETDRAGNVSVATSLVLTVDTEAPKAPVVTLAPESDTGVAGDGVTSNTRPTMTGSGGTPGDTIVVSVAGGETLTTTVAANGGWSVVPSTAMAAGSNTVTITATDPAGNVSAASTLTVVVDTSAPMAPVARLAADSDTGISGDGITSNARPTVSGRGAAAGDLITVSITDGEVLTTRVADDGNWSVTPTADLAAGDTALSITATDAAGNVSAASTMTIHVDASAPAAPVVALDPGSDTGVVGDGLTGNARPTISGNAGSPGDTIAVAIGAGEVLDTTVAADGRWSVTPSLALDDGATEVRVTALDAAGNLSAATTLMLQIDTTAPVAPIAILDGSSDTGVPGDNLTGNTRPTLSGSAANPGDTITIDVAGGEMLTATVGVDGTWSATPTIALAAGANELTVTATDPAGNVSATSSLSIRVDAEAPSAPQAALEAISDTGELGDNITSNTKPTIAGSSASPGDTITVVTPTGEVLTTTVGEDGAWLLTPAIALAAGSNTLMVSAIDAAGNRSVATVLVLQIDGATPAELAVSSDSGAPGDNITSDTTPTIVGASASSGDTITVTTPRGEVLTTTVDPDGTWSVTPTLALAAGRNNLSLTTTDSDGVKSAESSLTLEIDAVAPVAPTAGLDADADTGVIGDNLTSDTTPTIAGASAGSGDTIAVSIDGGEVLTTTVADDGTWSVTPGTALASGNTELTVNATDVAGNVSADTTLIVQIDTSAPTAPNATLDGGSDTGVTGDGLTSNTKPTISGSAATSGDTITVRVADGEVLTTTVAANGTWSVTPTVGLEEGETDLSITATDPAGNRSAATTVTVQIDAVAPAAPLAVLDGGSDTGVIGDGMTNNAKPTISGSAASSGDTITVTIPDGEVLTSTVAANGTWSVTPTVALDGGETEISVTATDAAGNVSAATTLIVSVDTTAPLAPAAVLDASVDTGVSGDGITSNTKPTISGSTASGGDTITVTVPGGEVLTTTVASNGTWSVTPTVAMNDGETELSITATDAAGNVSAAAVLAVNIDATAPAAPVAVLDASADTGVSGDGLTNNAKPTVSGSAATSGDTITVTVPGGEVLTATVAANGTWSVTPTVALDPGETELSIIATDPAGNVSAATTLTIEVDATAPTAPIAVLDASVDTGVSGDGITNNTKPTISGSAASSGDTITVTIPDGEVLTTTVAANGAWSVTPTVALDAGQTELSIIATDAAGNVSAATTLTIEVDAIAPSAPAAVLDASVDTGVSGDGLTSNAKPTISGAGATSGDTITVTVPDGEVLTAMVAANGTWSVTPTVALDAGETKLSITATDAAGNVSAATTLTVEVDAVAPSAPIAVLDVGSDTGVSGDGLTNDAKPTISGSAASSGDTITVTVPDGEVMTATVAANGTWSVTPSVALDAGETELSITATDAAGNVSAATTLTVELDATAPSAPTAVLNASSDTGVSGDGLTNNPKPTISGSAATSGDTITVTVLDGEVLTATVSANGTWSVTPAVAWDAGETELSITATDPAGNVSAATTLTIEVDAIAPSAPAAVLDASVDTGVSGDGITSNTKPTISGSAASSGDTITVTIPGDEVLTATVAANGTWSVTPTVALDAGETEMSITAADPAGNVSAATTLTIEVDATPPSAPAAVLDASSDTGVSGDGITSNTKPTISGSAATSGDTITVTVPGGEVLTATVAANGTWSVTPTVALDAGETELSITATDPAGNVSAATTLTIEVDATAPAAPVAVLDAGSDTGVSGDGITSNTKPVISGSAATNGDIITVTIPDGEVLTATVAANGTWSVTPTVALDAGETELSIIATDPAGNVSAATTLTVEVDATAPAAPIAVLDASADTGVSGDGITSNSKPMISGSAATSGDTIAVTVPDGAVLTTTVAANGTWSVTPTVALDAGETELSITATDPAGNVSAATTLTIEVDATAPAAPAAALHASADTGVSGDGITSNTKPMISGSAATSGDTITVTVPGGEVLTATVAANGTWSVTPTVALDVGETDLSITATDPAGNVSAATTLTVEIDAVAPTAPAAVLDAGSDSGVTGDGITSNTKPTISGSTATSGDTITVTVPGGEVLTTTVAANGTWSVTPTVALDAGETELSITATDPAGNVSAATTLTIEVDATAPAAPVAVLDAGSDTGVSGDGITSNTKPVVSGSAATSGDTITVTIPDGEVLTATVAANGTWSVTPTVALDAGETELSITATDPAGNVSAATTLTIEVDATAPLAPAAVLDASADTGVSGDGLTNNAKPIISGSAATSGDTITVTVPGGEVLTATVAANGTWSVTPTVEFDAGETELSITATDPAGNVSATTTLTVEIDAVAPTAPAAVLDASADTGVSGDGITSNTKPMISGSAATSGDTITVTVPDGEVLTATVAANGTWSVTPTVALDAGDTELSITATDPAGNVSAATTLTVEVDATAPLAPNAVLDASADTGVSGDGITSNTKPTISGSAATSGDTITVTVSGGEVLTATVAANGTWSVTPTVAFDAGETELSITATDPAGNVSAATTLTVEVDATAPAAPTAVLDASADTGVSGDGITSNAKPLISGAAATSGDTITVTVPDGEVLTTTVAANGTWSVTPTVALDAGETDLSVTATDPAGNLSAATTLTIEVDATAPAAPVAVLDASADTGVSGDGITSNTKPVISGSAATSGDTITVTIPEGEVLTATVAANGTWSVTPTVALDAGETELSITAADPAGNESATTALTVGIDAVAPTAPAAVLDASADTGVSGDGITSNTKPMISGSAATSGDTITVTVPDGEVLSTTVAANGTWSVTPTVALDAGETELSITATDPAGNVSAATTLTVEVDADAPSAPTAIIDASADTGVAGDGITSNSKPMISGSAATSGDTITVTVSGGEVLTATVAANGTWSVTPTVALDAGETELSITATDLAGNVSAATTLTVEVDATAPLAPTAVLDASADTGVSGDGITSNAKPTISGSAATSGDTITVTVPDGEVLTTTVAANGTWSVTPTVALDAGETELSITATDPAGNESATTTLTVEIDAVAPTAPAAVLDASADTGVSGDGVTSNTKPMISGSAATSGDTITVTVADGEVLTTTVAANGTWSVTPTVALDAGETELSITATDPAGNVSAATTLTIEVDATAPAAPVAVLDAGSDTGVSGDGITSNTKPVISGSAATSGDTITVTIPDGEVLTATVAANGTWSVTPTVALDAGETELSIIATDPAGNVSAATTLTVDVDADAPSAPTAIIDASADTGVTGDGITSNTKPTISGSAATRGDTITVTVSGGEVLTATVAANGTWSVTPTVALDAGETELSITATDPAGNVSAATTLTVEVDATAPAAPTAVLDASADTGVSGDGITSNAKPMISGAAAISGDTITVTVPDGEVLTTTVAANGTWSVTPTVALDAGETELSITATDPAGNVSAATALTVEVDADAPSTPTAIIDASADTGVTGDGITSNTKPIISGSAATSGDTITVTVSGGEVLTATVAANGTWSVTPTVALDAGETELSITATDPAGNVSAATTLTVEVDATAPLAPNAVLDASADTGVSGDNLTNNTKPMISGSAATSGDTITVTVPGGEVLTATVAANGTWSVTPTVALDAGEIELSVTATDPAGNVSAATTLTIEVDADAPSAPAAIIDAIADTGVPGDGITSNTKPVISGSAASSGDTITVTVPGGEVLTTTVAANGTWSVTPTVALDAGETDLSITATDAAGNVSVATVLTVDVDASAPSAPAAVLDVSADTGVSGDGLTNNTKPMISGSTATSGDTITVTVSGGEVLTATVAANGTWAVTPTIAWDAGETEMSITATDAAGNVSAATTLTVEVDTTASSAPLAVLDVSADTGVTGDGITSNTKPVISGSAATSGDTITVTVPGGEVLTATVAANGTWSVTPTVALDAGETDLSITATDPAGNVSAATTLTVEIDLTAPSAPGAVLDVSADTGVLGDGITNNAKPTISGSAATSGDTITVTVPGGEVLTTTVAANGTWAVTPTVALDAGETELSITATDPAGNVSAATSLTVELDATQPLVAIDAAASVIDWNQTTTLTFTLSEASLDFTAADVSVTGGAISAFAGSGTSYTALLTPSGSADPVVEVGAGAFADSAGLGNTAGSVSVEVNATIADTGSALEDANITGNVLANDVAGLSVDSYVVSGNASSVAAGVSASIDGVGVITVEADGDYLFVPALDWSGTVPTITYTASGGSHAETTGVLNLSVDAVLDLPVVIAPATLFVNSANSFDQLSTDAQLDAATIEALLDVDAGWMETHNPVTFPVSNPANVIGIDGDIRSYDVTLQAGESISYDWAFQSDESNLAVLAGKEDVALLHVQAPDGSSSDTIMASSASFLNILPAIPALPLLSYWDTGTLTYTADEAGTYRMSFVVFNGGDDLLGARLNVSAWDLPVTAVDLPLFALADTDGSEVFVSITVSDLPTGASLNHGTVDGDGVWTLDQEDLSGLQLLLPGDYAGGESITVAATSTEQGSGETSSTVTQTIAIEVNAGPIADLAATNGVETYAGTTGNDFFAAQGGDDVLDGDDGADSLLGEAGADIIDGGAGNDMLAGGIGNDTLDGEAGLDRIYGGSGSDAMTGGAGRDLFIWLAGDVGVAGSPDQDVINDFSIGASGDLLVLGDLLDGAAYGNLDSYLSYALDGSDTIISVSTTGGYSSGYLASQTDLSIELVGVDLVTGGLGLSGNITNELISSGNLYL